MFWKTNQQRLKWSNNIGIKNTRKCKFTFLVTKYIILMTAKQNWGFLFNIYLISSKIWSHVNLLIVKLKTNRFKAKKICLDGLLIWVNILLAEFWNFWFLYWIFHQIFRWRTGLATNVTWLTCSFWLFWLISLKIFIIWYTISRSQHFNSISQISFK